MDLAPNSSGAFAEMSAKANPFGLALVHMPPFRVILFAQEDLLGRVLSGSEFAEHRAKSIVMAMPVSIAEKMAANRPDITTYTEYLSESSRSSGET